MQTMLFNNRYVSLKPFYKHLNIPPLTENIKALTGEIHVETLSQKTARLYKRVISITLQ